MLSCECFDFSFCVLVIDISLTSCPVWPRNTDAMNTILVSTNGVHMPWFSRTNTNIFNATPSQNCMLWISPTPPPPLSPYLWPPRVLQSGVWIIPRSGLWATPGSVRRRAGSRRWLRPRLSGRWQPHPLGFKAKQMFVYKDQSDRNGRAFWRKVWGFVKKKGLEQEFLL